MSKLVTLDEQEAYEAELRRAHAEGRAPSLRNPHDVFADNLGNAEHHLEELSAADQKKADRALKREQKEALKQDATLRGVIRDSSNRLSDGEGSVTPYQAPDPDNASPPRNEEEKKALAEKVDKDYEYQRSFDDSFADSNIQNRDDDGNVLGDSVNIVLTRKMPTSSPDELVRQDERNSVPVPERFKVENPPQVIQQENPITGDKPEPVPGGYHEDYKPATEDGEGVVLDASDVPLTAISVPHPEHVISDETGTTREPSRDNETDVNSPASAPDFPETVPLTEGQVAQGAVKRPDHFSPPVKDSVEDISQGNVAGTVANLPVDSTGLRGDNAAHKAVVEATEFQPPGNVEPSTLTDEQKEYTQKLNAPNQ